MEWAAIIAMLLEVFGPLLQDWLDDCLQPDERGIRTLRRFGPMVQLGIYRAAKAEAEQRGCNRRDCRQQARQAVREAREDIEQASDEALRMMLQGVREAAEADD